MDQPNNSDTSAFQVTSESQDIPLPNGLESDIPTRDAHGSGPASAPAPAPCPNGDGTGTGAQARTSAIEFIECEKCRAEFVHAGGEGTRFYLLSCKLVRPTWVGSVHYDPSGAKGFLG